MKVILIGAVIIFIPLAVFLPIVMHSIRFGLGSAVFIVSLLAFISLMVSYREVKPMTAQVVIKMGKRTDRVLTEGPDASIIPLLETTEEISLKIRKSEASRVDHFSKDGVNFFIEGTILWRPDVGNLKKFLDFQESAIDGFLKQAFKNIMREFIGARTEEELLENQTQQITEAKTVTQQNLKDYAENFGIEIVDVEIPDIDLSEAMQKAREQRSVEKFEQESEVAEAQTIAQQAKELAETLEIDPQEAIDKIMEWRTMKELASSGDLGILWDRVSRTRRRKKK